MLPTPHMVLRSPMSFGMLPLSGYLEIISTVQCQSGQTGSLHGDNRSIDPSGRGTDETTAAYISQHNGFYLHEMELIEMDTQTRRYWTF